MLMSMKQFKILNKKLNSIVESQADMGGGSSLSSFEIDGLMKASEEQMLSKMSGMIRDTESIILKKVDQNDQNTELRFWEVISMLKDLKDSVLKPATSSIITPEFLSQKFLQFKDILHKQLAPLSTISNLLPIGAPPVRTRVQGERRKLEKLFTQRLEVMLHMER
ncbi:unnamed protein product [Lactuca saligna]|uniref:Uncharacterized protein n=1 Tax=Lactuca saligna TaxID=75948 RepID=A0AA35VD43_LACSI|nr:unnamed protein product [Lactuca saligna]